MTLHSLDDSLEAFESVADVIRSDPSQSVLCFSPRHVRKNVETFLSGFPGAVSWAIKSNPHPEIVRAVAMAGVNAFDVSSRGEMAQLRYQHPWAELHFNHPAKSPEDIAYAYVIAGVRDFTVDHLDEVDKIATVLTKVGMDNAADVTLMVRFRDPSYGGNANYDFGSKFGATPAAAAEILKDCYRRGFSLGLSSNPGSQERDPAIYAQLLRLAERVALRAGDGVTDKIIKVSVGGGFPCRYPNATEPTLQDYFEAASDASFFGECAVYCEPGRSVVADSISVIAKVTLLKPTEGIIHLNDGIYGSFMESKFVDFSPPVRAYTPRGVRINAGQDGTDCYTIMGPTCDSLDQLPQKVRLPKVIKTGDYLEFGMMGAYSNATATRFNGLEPARLVLVDGFDQWGSESYAE